jgi:hypothetical protein
MSGVSGRIALLALLWGSLSALVVPVPAAAGPAGPGRVRFRLKQPCPDFMTFYGTRART